MVSDLNDICKVLDYLPHVEKFATHFSATINNTRKSTSAIIATAAPTKGIKTYPEIHSMQLYGYRILLGQDDMLNIQKFSNLGCLNI